MNDPLPRVPPLNALRAFEAAARHLSFVAAANELCVTPAAISHQIKGLEEYLEIQLFHRQKRKVILTEQGEIILPELKQAFSLIERAMENLAKAGQREVMTVSATPAFMAKWLLPRIHLFHDRYPEIDIRLDATHELQDLEQDQVDVAIRFGSGIYPGMECKPLRPGIQESVSPVCSPVLLKQEKPLTRPEDLLNHTLLHDETVKDEKLLPNWQHWLKAAGVTSVPNHRGLRFNNSVLAIEAAINGQGVALSCGLVVADDLAAGRLIRPFDIPCSLEYNYFIIYPRTPRKKENVEKFHQWLITMCDEVDSQVKLGSANSY